MTINIILAPLPHAKASMSPNDDGSYTIVINNQMSSEQIKHEILHEVSHIKRNDFTVHDQATLLESMVRESGFIEDDFEDINFYCHVV